MLLQHSVFLGYERLKTHILFLHLSSTFFDPRKIYDKLSNNLVAEQIFQLLSSPQFVFSPLKLISKGDSKFYQIHQFFLPIGSSANNLILKKIVHLCYPTRDNLLQEIVVSRREFVIIKHKIKNAFSKIFLVSHLEWLLGSCLGVFFFTENCLDIKLWTLLFIFNFYMEAFHWILQFFLSGDWEHNLNYFMTLLLAIEATLNKN